MWPAQEQERNVLLEQLDVALREEADLHRKESQRLNEELYLQEKKNCDSYVEKRLLQARRRGGLSPARGDSGRLLWRGRWGAGGAGYHHFRNSQLPRCGSGPALST